MSFETTAVNCQRSTGYVGVGENPTDVTSSLISAVLRLKWIFPPSTLDFQGRTGLDVKFVFPSI